MVAAEPESYDFAVFGVLAYEFSRDDPKDAERKIRRKLSRHHLGGYDQLRVDLLRRVKNDLQSEFSLQTKSLFYVGSLTPHFGSVEDFDQRKLAADLASKYPTVTLHDLGRMVSLGMYLYYLR